MVAQAPKDVAVPNVVGKSEAAGRGGARAGGLHAKDGDRHDQRTGAGRARAEAEPGRRHRAPKGATVTITIGVTAADRTPTTPTTPTTTPTTTTPDDPDATRGHHRPPRPTRERDRRR